jgi:hypothetical protein
MVVHRLVRLRIGLNCVVRISGHRQVLALNLFSSVAPTKIAVYTEGQPTVDLIRRVLKETNPDEVSSQNRTYYNVRYSFGGNFML